MADSAHVIHPLAGQGLNLGLADAALLAELVLQDYAHKNERIKYSTLRRYERARKADNATMLAAMDGFKHLFGNDIPAIKWLRHRGLSLTNRLSFVKNLILPIKESPTKTIIVPVISKNIPLVVLSKVTTPPTSPNKAPKIE